MFKKVIDEQSDRLWLPDLCNALALLRLLILAVLVALILTLLRQGVNGLSIQSMGVLFLYSAWVAFISAAGLCFLRRFISGLSIMMSASIATAWLIFAGSFCALAAGLFFSTFLLQENVPANQLWLETAITNLIIGALVLRFLFAHHQLQMQQKRLMQAQYDALQARIRPHFLFNSLNSIASMAGIDGQRTEDAILNLSDILRATLGEKESISLGEELDTCHKYLQIEKLRMGERLQLSMNIDTRFNNMDVPPLFLQPLMENAILHALQQMPQGGELKVSVQGHNEGVEILVENPLSQLPKASSGTQGALINVRARLQQFFADRLVFEAGQVDEKYKVKVYIKDVRV